MTRNTSTTNGMGSLPLFMNFYHSSTSSQSKEKQREPMSNLSILLSEQEKIRGAVRSDEVNNTLPPYSKAFVSHKKARTATETDEAGSASGPPISLMRSCSAPTYHTTGPHGTPTSTPLFIRPRRSSTEAVDIGRIRRCVSSSEFRTLAPPFGSPCVNMLRRKEELEIIMQELLLERRESISLPSACGRCIAQERTADPHKESCSSKTAMPGARTAGTNETRNQKRAEHHQAVVNDLCEVVADLFVAESKLLKPSTYGVSHSITTKTYQRDDVLWSVQKFVSALPIRYALGVDTPSEVLLHMRLMSVVRSDPSRAVVHISKLEDDSQWRGDNSLGKGTNRIRFLVTISCADTDGLLEYMTKVLGTRGSSVLDADVMLSSDRIVLDRFVVEMTGRLRLDKLASLIESFIQKKNAREDEREAPAEEDSDQSQTTESSISGQVYFDYPPFNAPEIINPGEIQSAVPLAQVLASPQNNELLPSASFPELHRWYTIPRITTLAESPLLPVQIDKPTQDVSTKGDTISMRHKSNQVNGGVSPDLERVGLEGPDDSTDGVQICTFDGTSTSRVDNHEIREIPLIPFDDLMLIETLGTGRVSTIYRAARQRSSQPGSKTTLVSDVQIVALKVAMVDHETGGTARIDELRREADIAARLEHPNVSELVGVAADADCFCLAYDFCEGGSLLSLLSDTSRYYEYLPIALDIANGMSYLHSRNVIHRDLKPANILLSRDHRAKIADFGMSVAIWGQELTAETGTYRYMAPEVIRHESYSSNADVYSFGICLWQLITRQVPFASMTPIQAAYAVAQGHRPEIPPSTPKRLRKIIRTCWDQDSHRRPSFTCVVMALADYAKEAFSPATVGAQTLQIANDMLANVEGNATINVDFTTPVATQNTFSYPHNAYNGDPKSSNVGLEIK